MKVYVMVNGEETVGKVYDTEEKALQDVEQDISKNWDEFWEQEWMDECELFKIAFTKKEFIERYAKFYGKEYYYVEREVG